MPYPQLPCHVRLSLPLASPSTHNPKPYAEFTKLVKVFETGHSQHPPQDYSNPISAGLRWSRRVTEAPVCFARATCGLQPLVSRLKAHLLQLACPRVGSPGQEAISDSSPEKPLVLPVLCCHFLRSPVPYRPWIWVPMLEYIEDCTTTKGTPMSILNGSLVSRRLSPALFLNRGPSHGAGSSLQSVGLGVYNPQKRV